MKASQILLGCTLATACNSVSVVEQDAGTQTGVRRGDAATRDCDAAMAELMTGAAPGSPADMRTNDAGAPMTDGRAKSRRGFDVVSNPTSPWKPASECGLPVRNDCVTVNCPESSAGPMVATLIAEVGNRITAFEQPPGEAEDFYVADQQGQIFLVRDGAALEEPFLDLADELPNDVQFEQGLLGMEFDPRHEDNGVLWVSYTGRGGESVIASVKRDTDNPDVADKSTLTTLFAQPQPRTIHNAGDMHFGRDGCLYVSIGDGGTMFRASATNTMLGKILRVDPWNFEVPPPGNLTGAKDEDVVPYIWSLGLRNPWRFSFDRVTADLYIGDVGDADFEEVTVEAAGVGHLNHGWKFKEGPLCRQMTEDPECEGDYRDPIAYFPHDIAGVKHKVVVGGFVYRGSRIPSLYGRYLYGDYETRRIWSFVYHGDDDRGQPVACSEQELTDQLVVGRKLTSFGEDNAGELYILAFGGKIYRIDPVE